MYDGMMLMNLRHWRQEEYITPLFDDNGTCKDIRNLTYDTLANLAKALIYKSVGVIVPTN